LYHEGGKDASDMSPIRGLTDTVNPAFPYIGKLRKGGPRPEDGKRPGPDLDHFRFTSERQEVLDAFHQAYGEEPRELDVYLPYARIEDNFDTWREAWKAGGMLHRCDGKTCTVWLQEDGTYSTEPIPCPGNCKQVGRLSLILPALLRAEHVGCVTLETHGNHDLMSIQKALLATAEARGSEDLRGIGFCLRRVQEAVSTPGSNGTRVRRKKWLVKLEPAAVWVRAQLEASRAQALLPNGSTASIEKPPIHIVDPKTGEVVGAEYMKAKYGQAERAGAPPQHAPPGDMEKELYGEAKTPKAEAPEAEAKAEPAAAERWTADAFGKLHAVVKKATLSSSKWRELLGLPEDAQASEVMALGTVDEVIKKLNEALAEAVAEAESPASGPGVTQLGF